MSLLQVLPPPVAASSLRSGIPAASRCRAVIGGGWRLFLGLWRWLDDSLVGDVLGVVALFVILIGSLLIPGFLP